MALLKELLTDRYLSEERWLIENLLGLGEITILYAPKDHHKTGMALKMAMEVITGGKELGASLNGKVLYYSLDTAPTEMIYRARALMESTYPDHLEEIGLSLDINFQRLWLANKLRFTIDYDDPDEELDEYTASWGYMGHRLLCDGYRLLIIDTLSKGLVGNGVNDDSAIRQVIHNLRLIIGGGLDRISILVVHHPGKDTRKGMMGSSILSNDISTVLKIKKSKDGFNLTREKHKSSYSGKSIPFKYRTLVMENEGTSHESVYVDIGSGLDQINAEIVTQYQKGLTKEETRSKIQNMGIGNWKSNKSFTVSFNNRWKSLIDKGFIDTGKSGNHS